MHISIVFSNSPIRNTSRPGQLARSTDLHAVGGRFKARVARPNPAKKPRPRSLSPMSDHRRRNVRRGVRLDDETGCEAPSELIAAVDRIKASAPPTGQCPRPGDPAVAKLETVGPPQRQRGRQGRPRRWYLGFGGEISVRTNGSTPGPSSDPCSETCLLARSVEGMRVSNNERSSVSRWRQHSKSIISNLPRSTKPQLPNPSLHRFEQRREVPDPAQVIASGVSEKCVVQRKRTRSGEVVPPTHPMPQLGNIDLAADVRILVRTRGIGTAAPSRALLVRAASMARTRLPDGRRTDIRRLLNAALS